jgi:hypothetical protein
LHNSCVVKSGADNDISPDGGAADGHGQEGIEDAEGVPSHEWLLLTDSGRVKVVRFNKLERMSTILVNNPWPIYENDVKERIPGAPGLN